MANNKIEVLIEREDPFKTIWVFIRNKNDMIGVSLLVNNVCYSSDKKSILLFINESYIGSIKLDNVDIKITGLKIKVNNLY